MPYQEYYHFRLLSASANQINGNSEQAAWKIQGKFLGPFQQMGWGGRTLPSPPLYMGYRIVIQAVVIRGTPPPIRTLRSSDAGRAEMLFPQPLETQATRM